MSNTNHKTLRGAMAIAHTPLGKSGLPGKFTLFTVASDCVLSNYRIQSAMTLDPYATSAKYYDAFIRPEKPDGLTETELALVQAYVPPVPQNGVKVRALDLGCGTGRHLEGLAKLGYEVIGVDTSEAMLQVAAQKVPTARLVNVDLANIKDEAFVSFAKDVEQVDLITCFWNAWAEIALTDDLADVLLKRLKLLLKLDGKLLINITDTDAKDPSKFNYSVISETDGEKYIHSASVEKYDAATRTTTTKEVIEVVRWNAQGQDLEATKEVSENVLVQRWWTSEDLSGRAAAHGWQLLAREKIKSNPGEWYLIFIGSE